MHGVNRKAVFAFVARQSEIILSTWPVPTNFVIQYSGSSSTEGLVLSPKHKNNHGLQIRVYDLKIQIKLTFYVS